MLADYALVQALNSGHAFYPWQRRLLDDWLLRGRLPEAVDVPTGLGKTKAMTAWLLARMLGAPLPRRLVYVVDRRTVVDQATNEAAELAKSLQEVLAGKRGAFDAEDRELWRENLGLAPNGQLAISTLRGQHMDNRAWMADPGAGAIVVGTVDMVGSRLLFSGYGVSRGMRPAHAALLGCDTLVVLDEAHLVPPFEELLRQVVEFSARDRARQRNIVPPFLLMTLSATGRERDATRTLALDDADVENAVLSKRLNAEKRLRLLPDAEKGTLAETLSSRAWELSQGGRRLLIFCNSRKTAQEVEADLASRVARAFGKDARLTELLVGERRVRERLLMSEPNQPGVLARFAPGATNGDVPAFLVATSAGEVGIDLDADDIVCDLVAWERMVQRFGRVNRRAEPAKSMIEVVPAISDKESEDPIAVERLEEIRAPFMSDLWPCAEDGTRDASPSALSRLKRVIPSILEAASTPRPFYPLLTAPLIDAWALTTLKEHPGRTLVAPWLRGWVDQIPQCSVLWRRFFPLRDNFDGDDATVKYDVGSYFDSAPPHRTEILEAPVFRITELLRKRCDAWLSAEHPSFEREPVVTILDSSNELVELLKASAIAKIRKAAILERRLADRTIVIDARLGGLAQSGLLDLKASEIPSTIDDEEANWKLPLSEYGGRHIRYGKYQAPNGAWRHEGYRWQADPEDSDGDVLWVDVLRSGVSSVGDPAVARTPQTLTEHHEWTRQEAIRISRALGLNERFTAIVVAAAAFHDAGKSRDLWQDAMNARRLGRPYAKTAGGASTQMLAGYRHEFGSVGEALENDTIAGLDPTDQDLALHLIAAHHGYSRPTIYAFDPLFTPTMSRELAQKLALRFARLQHEWGPWGLAWLESLVRAADWAASRRLDANG